MSLRLPNRPGRLVVQLSDSVAAAPAPCHLDVVAGAGRPLGRIDGGGRIDRALARRVDAIRAHLVFHARASLGSIGAQSAGYDDAEHAMGLSRTFHVRLSDPETADAVVQDLLDSGMVDWAMPEPLAGAPLDAADTVEAQTPVSVEAVLRHRDMVGASAALDMEPGDRSVVVAVADTGVALTHREFSGRLRAGLDTVDLGLGALAAGMTLVGDSRGRDFCARDETGHGSHVAGVIGASGVHISRGLAGAAMLAPVRVLAAARFAAQRSLVGVGGLTDIDAGLKACIDLGAAVVNMSFGTPMDEVAPGAEAPHAGVVRYALDRGVILVAAMGNSGKAETYYPAALPGVIAVASVSDDGRRSAFSTSGAHASLSAPGERVVSVGLEGYRESTGTSHAAPFVSAACALLAARARRAGVALTGPQAKAVLEDSARPLPGSARDEVGAGLLDAAAAVRRLDERLQSQRRAAA